MSGDGGLSLPSDNSNNASSSSAPPAAATAPGGLPLDLFSAPSPTPSPGPSFFTPAYSNSTSQAPRQDPMAFFNTSPAQSQPQQQSQQRYGPTANTDFFGSFSSAPQGTSSSGFGGSQQSQQRPPQQQQGYSINTPTMQPTQQNQNRNTNPNQNQTQQQQQQQKKPDAFADLVDLMS